MLRQFLNHVSIRKTWPLVALFALFAISVAIRLPSFNFDPMKNDGWTVYARWNNGEVWEHDKYVTEVYQQYPASVHKFVPYVGSSSEFLHNKKAPELSVYTSFPAAHFVAFYFFAKVFGGHYTYFTMQIFSLLIHATCVLLLYYLVRLLTKDELWSVVAASMYIFSTGTLWNHMNVYWAHQLLMPFFLVSLIIFVKQKGILRWWQALCIGTVLSLITWTGAVASLGYLLYGLYKYYQTRDKNYLNYLYIIGGVFVGIGATIVQILATTGADIPAYFNSVSNRVQARTVDSKTMTFSQMVWQSANNLFLDFGSYAIIGYTFALKQKLSRFEWEVIFVAAFPIIESFILIEHDSVYGFARLKWLVPIILLVALAGSRMADSRKKKIITIGALVIASIIHILTYYVIYILHPLNNL